MPSERRSKEQTWKEGELKASIKGSKSSKDGKSSRTRDKDTAKDSDRTSEKLNRDRDKEKGRQRDDRDRERRLDEGDRRDKKDKSDRDDKRRDDSDRHRDKDGRSDRQKDDKDRHRSDRDRDRDKENRDDRHRSDRDQDSERRQKENRDRDKHREDRERGERDRHRDDRDRDKQRDGKDRDRRRDDRDRHQKDDRDRDRHRDDRDRDKDRRKDDKDGDRHRDERDRDRDRRKDDKDRDRHRDEKEKERDKDRRRDVRDKGSDRHKDDRDKNRHRDDKDRDKRPDDRDRDRKDRDRRDGDRHDKDKERSHHRSDRDRSRHRDDKERSHRDKSDKERSHHDKEDRKHGDGRKRRSDRKPEEERGGGSGERHKSSDRKLEEEVRERNVERVREDRAKSSRNTRAAHTEKESNSPAVKAEEEEADGYGDYDEDFEEYDEDFEDFEDDEETDVKNMNNKEVDDLFEAINAENDRLMASSQRSDMTDSSDDRHVSKRPQTSRQRGFINFVAAKQRDMSMKTANAARKRCTELFKIIDLDTVSLSLFDLPPVKEYDLYMSSFGRTNAHQVAIQTRDDNLDRDIQTENIEYEEKWTQHPAEDRHGSGTGGDNKQKEEKTPKTDIDEGRLASFLLRSCQVIEKLISEEQSKSNLSQSSDSFSSSEAYTALRHCEILSSRDVTSCQFSTSDSNMLLTLHDKPNQPVEKMVDTYGMVAIWNINNPSSPQKVAVSAGVPSCCCFSPNKTTLLFGGMADGSVAAWDLRESKTMHHSHICGGKDWLLRLPTYNTAGVMNESSHTSPVTAIVPIVSETNKSSLQDSGLGLSFQLATLEERGVINLWVVAEVIETSQAGSESDLGLSPKGKIKLLKSSAIVLLNPNMSYGGLDFRATSLQLSVSNQNHFYIPTDSGVVIHGTRFGNQKTIPRSYSAYSDTPCDITSIDLHPKGHPILAAGTDSGVLYLYHLQSDKPLLMWDSFTNGSHILKVLWSRNCSYVLFVLDSNSVIHMWDLLRNDTEPMASDTLPGKKVKDIHLSDERISGLKPKMSITLDDGTVEVHILSNHVSQLQPGEDEQFMRYINQL